MSKGGLEGGDQHGRRRLAPWVPGVMAAAALVLVGLLLRLANSGSDTDPLPVLSRVPPFELTDQFGRPLTLEDFAGAVWVAEIFFTRCPACRQMTEHMSALQGRVPEDAPVKFLSVTVDPEHDRPEVLRDFADGFEGGGARWHLATGSPDEIRKLAVSGFRLVAVEKAPEDRQFDEDLFLHSLKLVLVDAEGRVRAVFDGTNPEEHDRILKSMNALLQEAGLR